LFRQAAVQKKKVKNAQRDMALAQSLADQSLDDEDEEDSVGVYEALWDAVSPRTANKEQEATKYESLKQCHIEDFKLLKVLGKGSFGKVRI
jgi:hypothetical protein